MAQVDRVPIVGGGIGVPTRPAGVTGLPRRRCRPDAPRPVCAARRRGVACTGDGSDRGPGASPRDARKQVARLTAAGLVAADGPRLVARIDAIRAALEEVAPEEDGDAAGPARVRALFRRGRLVEIPRAPETRLALLRHLAERFEAGRRYREAEVNAVLRDVHDDHAALRRYLVDAGLLGRDDDGATYWRAGAREPDGGGPPAAP